MSYNICTLLWLFISDICNIIVTYSGQKFSDLLGDFFSGKGWKEISTRSTKIYPLFYKIHVHVMQFLLHVTLPNWSQEVRLNQKIVVNFRRVKLIIRVNI